MNARTTFAGAMIWAGIGLVTLPFGTALAQEDCALGQRYVGLARERLAAFENDEAVEFLRQSVRACPSYEGYQLLGEALAQSPETQDQRGAVAAFVSAHERAPSNAARATTLYRYADLLSRAGDPQNAYPLIKDAERLAPGNPEIAALSQRIQAQVEHPTPQQIVRGLKDSLYQPLRIASVATASAVARIAQNPAAIALPPLGAGPSVNIPINFVTGSTQVDAETRANVVQLAQALADPGLAGKRFLFVGHADVRGDELRNVDLSRQRAEVLAQTVMMMAPSLDGRIETVGRGAYEPIDHGQGERAYRANRRLQVLLK